METNFGILKNKKFPPPLLIAGWCNTNHCSKWAWAVEEIWTLGIRLRSKPCRMFEWLALPVTPVREGDRCPDADDEYDDEQPGKYSGFKWTKK